MKHANGFRRGFALVLVLIAIVLVTAMAVFFLSSVGRERRGVGSYARSGEARHLSGMAVNRVIGQISAATREGTAAAPVSWASQPGMVRTFQAAGDARNIYKLYSWDSAAVEAGTGFDPLASAQLPPGDWNARKAEFTDLNQPVDGLYPILDPAAAGVVQGFSIDSANAAVSASGLAAPMPVRWLYVLQDGRLVAPTGGGGTAVTVSGASSANPIVGRIAYWTDDETAKVNVNTASEGAYWDWPKAATFNEMQFAGNPPVGGEFNRLPGHPALTSLSAVFPELDPGSRWGGVSAYRAKLKTILDLTPRVRYDDASSRGGTYPVDEQNFIYGPTGSLGTIPSASLLLKTDRLFVSPDEMIFSATNRTLQTAVTSDMLRRRSFFLTAHSRAPETTLFETPRVSLWPVTWPWNSAHASVQRMTSASAPNPNTAALSANTWMRAEERLLAFDATLNRLAANGGNKYYFQRQNPDSPTHDFANIDRNEELLKYLQRTTGLEVPGFGASLAGKWGAAARDGILVNSFSSVRSLVNQYTTQDDGRMLYSFTPVAFTRFKQKNSVMTAGYAESGAFSPVPIKADLGSGEVTGLSEFPALREAALVFFATDRVAPTPKSGVTNRNNPYEWDNLINVTGTGGYPVGARTTQMRAVLALDFTPIGGSSRSNQPVFWVKLAGGSLQAAGQNLDLGNAVAKMDFRAKGTLLRVPSFMRPFYEKDSEGSVTKEKTFNNGGVSDTNYGLISTPVAVNPTAVDFPFNGNTITVEVYGIKDGNPNLDPTSDATLRVASYQVDFSGWNGNFAIPLMPWWNYRENPNAPGTAAAAGCPSPRYADFANSDSSVPDVGPTEWVAMEIAPLYRSANSAWDPALGGAGSTMAIWSETSLFRSPQAAPATKTDEGDFKFNTDSQPPAYARAYQGGALMTDFSKRARMPASLGLGTLNALVSGNSLNPGSTGNMWAAGFPITTPYDTVISVVAKPDGAGNGDPRLAAKSQFERVDTALGAGVTLRLVLPTSAYFPRLNRQYHTLGFGDGSPSATGYVGHLAFTTLGSGLAANGMARVGRNTGGGTGSTGVLGIGGAAGVAPEDKDAVTMVSGRAFSSLASNASVGDWSSQPGTAPDGGLVKRADQDFQAFSTIGVQSPFTYQTPYFRRSDGYFEGVDSAAASGNFSPNRQIASPITLLGSLPSSVTAGWQTLAFSPNPAAGASHPGLANPPDHLLLDLFWMPVAEPYPISEEFSTAGKINLNSQILPFSYIHRNTGLHALMKSTWITALDKSLAENYKSHYYSKDMAGAQTRYPIDPAETVKLFQSEVFDNGDIFRSASQICGMWLVPQGRTASNVQAFWSDKQLTSDTGREAPYDHLYSRVTTKSNTFTVHWRVQALRKAPGGDAATWDESRDKVQAELRGATLIERYLNPNATDTPDYATDPAAEPLSRFYKWRVVAENYFPY